MSRRARIALILFGLYALGVIAQDQIIRQAPKIARFFAPPAFQFSQSITAGKVSPFKIGMTDQQVARAAARGGLKARECHPDVEFIDVEGPASHCFSFEPTATYWDVWMVNGNMVGVRVYTSMNITSE